MARVLNLVRRSEGEFIYEEEIQPNLWIRSTPPAEVARRTVEVRRSEASLAALRDLQARRPAPKLGGGGAPPGVAEFYDVSFVTEPGPEPPAAPLPERVAAPAVQPAKLTVSPEQITRLVTETGIRKQQIKNFLAQPIGYVWQQSNKLPDHLVRVPIKRPTPTMAEIEQRFPAPSLPLDPTLITAPESQPIFRGFIQVEGGRRLNLWEDFRGNEIEGRREIVGAFESEF